jgi:hypothetical protein
MTSPNQLLFNSLNPRCKLYESSGKVDFTISRRWDTLIYDPQLKELQIKLKTTALSDPLTSSNVYRLYCDGVKTPDGGSAEDMRVQWIDLANNNAEIQGSEAIQGSSLLLAPDNKFIATVQLVSK